MSADVSLVIPVFNEARRLPTCLAQIAEKMKEWPYSCEVVVVVEKSVDETLQIAGETAARQANFRVIDNKVHRGKGYAVRSGMLAANGEYIFFMDVDLSVPLEEVARFVLYLEKNAHADVLIGNRQHAQSRILKRQSLLRQKMGQTFNHLIRSLTRMTIHDTQCGFKAFRRKVAREIFSHATIDGFAFDVEALILAQALGFKIVDLPVGWINSTDSKVHIVRDSVQMLVDVFRIRRLVDRGTRFPRSVAGPVGENPPMISEAKNL